ncbi:unnamed protein product [Pedinophyceae sp. YPF-701]|nr:unnamed protein product [Pedinophyceae sp. YPF-701]
MRLLHILVLLLVIAVHPVRAQAVTPAVLQKDRKWPGDNFGSSSAFAQDALLVGVALHDAAHNLTYVEARQPYDGCEGNQQFGCNTGKALLYSNINGAWQHTHTFDIAENLKAMNLTRGHFGQSVTVSADGTTVAAGAPLVRANDNRRSAPGLVAIFEKQGATWSLTKLGSAADFGDAQALTPDPLRGSDGFGRSVALDAAGVTLAVASPATTAGAVEFAGAVFTYTRNATGWHPHALMPAPRPRDSSGFSLGMSMSRDGRVLAAGEPGLFDSPSGVGVVWLYERAAGGGDWVRVHELASPSSAEDFGRAVGLAGDGSLLAVGAERSRVSGVAGAGSAYLYDLVRGPGGQLTPILAASLSAASPQQFAKFGLGLQVNGDGSRVVVGTKVDFEVAVYARHPRARSLWGVATVIVQPQNITEDNLREKSNTDFGKVLSMDASASRVAVGAPTSLDRSEKGEELVQSGLQFVAEVDRAAAPVGPLRSPLDGEVVLQGIGAAGVAAGTARVAAAGVVLTATSSNVAVNAAVGAAGAALAASSGAMEFLAVGDAAFTADGVAGAGRLVVRRGAWNGDAPATTVLSASGTQQGGGLGAAVWMEAGTSGPACVAAGAPGESSGSGRLHVYTSFVSGASSDVGARNSYVLNSPASISGAAMGTSVAGAPACAALAAGAVGNASASGAVIVFDFSNATSSFVASAPLTSPEAAPGDLFGAVIAFSADGLTLYVGAPGAASGEGRVLVFGRTQSSSAGPGGFVSAGSILAAAPRTPGAAFGASVAVAGSVLAAGARGHEWRPCSASRVRQTAAAADEESTLPRRLPAGPRRRLGSRHDGRRR